MKRKVSVTIIGVQETLQDESKGHIIVFIHVSYE
jgi:hypothetical protein